MLSRRSSEHESYARVINRLGWALMLFAVVFLTIQLSYIFLFENAANGGGDDTEVMLYGILTPICYMLPFFIAGVFFYAINRKEESQRPRIELRLPKVFPLIILAGLAINFAAATLNSIICELIGYSLPVDTVGGRYDDAGMVILYMGTALAPAFAEEFLFRGVIYSNLRPYGRTQALIISALAFALMHQNIAQFFYTFVFGVVMALMCEYTGSIWCSIIVHMMNNEISVIQEILYYGKFGEASWPILQLMELLVFVLGVLSIGLLILYDKKRKAIEERGGVGYFGTSGAGLERSERPLRTGRAFCALLTPGAITFAAYIVTQMVSLYFMYFNYNGG